MRTHHRHPAAAWLTIAWNAGEMLLGSGQVISHRLHRISAAGPKLSRRDHREFTLMGQEKIEAAADSASALARHAISVDAAGAAWVARRWMHLPASAMALAFSRTPAEAVQRYSALMRDVSQLTSLQAQLLAASARATADMLSPYHRRVAANAKRLGRILP